MTRDGADQRIIDERVALWAARLVAPTRTSDAVEVARLRAGVTADMPAIDQAARQFTQLGAELPPTRCRVLGRIGWVKANLVTLQGAFAPLADRIRTSRRIASRVLGIQVGAMLGLLSTKVLGQFVLPLGDAGTGELVLVGPNVLELAEEQGSLAADIRRTVLLHEVTHRLQFDGVPWLGDHIRGMLGSYLKSTRLDPSALMEVAQGLPDAVSRVRETGSITPLLEAVLSPEQRDVVQNAQAVMSLLEGHGNATMFLATDEVVDDIDAVREVLAQRRSDVATKILTAVAGLEMKKAQYRDGEAFVRAVVDADGVPRLNRAFEVPENLPSLDEVRDPDAWLARVGPRD